jgi:hypothetical protein
MMGSISLPALSVNPPQANSPLESMGRVASLQSMLQRNKMGKMELDEATAAKKEQDELQKLFMETNGDFDKLLEEAPKRGVRPQTIFKLKAAQIEQKEKLTKLDETTFKNAQTKSAVIGQAAGAILAVPPEQRGQALMQTLQGLVRQEVIQPQEAQQYAELAKAPPEVLEQKLKMFQMGAVSATEQYRVEAERRQKEADVLAKREERTAEEKNFQYEYQNYLAAEGLKPNAKLENDYRKVFKQNKASQLLTPEEEAQKVRIAKAGKTDISTGTPPDQAPPDPTSHSILAQTGLSYQAFMALTGQMSQLSRDKATRAQALKEAQTWANKKGVDVSTLGSQYKTYNEVLSKNISRLNNTKIMEDELQGTIQNLQGVIDPVDLKARFANVVRVWAGQEVNDDRAQQYALHLYQLRNELAAYGAATQGRSGNEINLQDQREAETTIKNGVAGGSLKGLGTAIENSTTKMRAVMERSVDRSRKSIWTLFGVGEKYSGGEKSPAGPKPTKDPLGIFQ